MDRREAAAQSTRVVGLLEPVRLSLKSPQLRCLMTIGFCLRRLTGRHCHVLRHPPDRAAWPVARSGRPDVRADADQCGCGTFAMGWCCRLAAPGPHRACRAGTGNLRRGSLRGLHGAVIAALAHCRCECSARAHQPWFQRRDVRGIDAATSRKTKSAAPPAACSSPRLPVSRWCRWRSDCSSPSSGTYVVAYGTIAVMVLSAAAYAALSLGESKAWDAAKRAIREGARAPCPRQSTCSSTADATSDTPQRVRCASRAGRSPSR